MARTVSHKKSTYYDILGISPRASFDDVKQAYRRLALEWHPDRNRGNQVIATNMLKIINEAYAHLKEDGVRSRYDLMLKRQHHKLTPPNDNGIPGEASHGLLGQFWSWLFTPDQRSQSK